MMAQIKRSALVLGALIFGAVNSAGAQTAATWDVNQPTVSRSDLEQLRARLDSAALSTAYSDQMRRQARLQSTAAQMRLTNGDFQVGDQVLVSVEGQFSDTFDVRPGRTLALPTIGDVPLQGVLRIELEQRLKEYVSRVIVEPIVRARPLINLAVIGHVLRPGYYAVQIDALLTEAIMQAGGPTATANLDQLVIVRGDQVLYTADALQEAIVAGKTLNQLGLRAGDRITIPAQQRRSVGEILRLAIVALPSIAFIFTRL